MAIPSKRSSPSLPFPIVNIGSYPNPRRLEIQKTSRKNLNEILFKRLSVLADPKGFNDVRPAVTHSDFLRIGKEAGVPPHHNEKQTENDKNLKLVRSRCPTVLKGTKDIITPKIASSPRKEVLVKRNEPIQIMAIPSKRSSPSLPFPIVDIGSYSNPRHLEIWKTSRKNLNEILFKKPSVLADPKGFNDVRPAGTHSDFPQIGKECGVPLHHNQKQYENDKKFKRVRIRCPNVSKGTKDIIIPKIAASSRKKMLVKRNEPIQTSISAFSYEKIKSISLLLFLLLVGWLWRTITDSPLISYTIDYSTDKMSSSIELFEAVEVTEFKKTNLDQMTRDLRLWSNNTSPCFSKMINIVKESSGLSFLRFGNSHEAHDIIFDKDYEGQFSLASEVELEAEKLHSEGKIISDAEFVASTIDHMAQGIITEKEQKAQIPLAFETKSELPQAEKFHRENSQIFKELSLSLKENSSIVNILGASFLILTLIVDAGLIFSKQKKSHTVSANSIPMDLLQAEKLASMPTKSKENTQVKLLTRNWPTEDGESCPYEISSFQRTASYSIKESKGVSEAQSQERGQRKSNKRNSLTLSSEYSMASPSNGSCTSYEKIQNKQGCGDQEVVTSIWRSTKTRNQELKSNEEAEFSSELAAGIDVCSQIRRSPPLASWLPAVGADPSVPPYDPKTKYLAPRPSSEYLTVSSSYSKNELKGASSTSECSMVSSSYGKNELKEASEVQTQQRGLRKSNKRETLTSHSDCSIRSTSYGSFTSYEKISCKYGGGQEVVIPVRRSCRIKKHVASL